MVNYPKKVGISLLLFYSIVVSGCATPGRDSPVRSIDGTGLPFRAFAPSGSAPFPAVILLHGCGGWWGGNITGWGGFLAEHGYYVVAIDSFTPRGTTEICTGLESAGRAQGGKSSVGVATRIQDAYGAFDYLAKLPDVDPTKIAAMGFSHGATTALVGVQIGAPGFYDRKPAEVFAAAVALYPHCPYSFGDGLARHAPSLVLEAEDDNWVGGGHCDGWAKRLSTANAPIRYYEIEDATHAFDLFSWRGQPVRPQTNPWGYEIVPNWEATLRARELVLAFLNDYLATESQR